MNIALRRRLIETAQALAKSNAPTLEHYENMLNAVADIFADDTSIKCECVIRTKKREAKVAP